MRRTDAERQNETLDEETAADEAQVSVEDYAHLLDDTDENSADRRRDPLRN